MTADAHLPTVPVLLLTLVLLAGCSAGAGDAEPSSDAGIRVPAGFIIEVFASDLPGVRTLKIGPDGLLYAVLSDRGRIVRMDPAASNVASQTVAEGLDLPTGSHSTTAPCS